MRESSSERSSPAGRDSPGRPARSEESTGSLIARARAGEDWALEVLCARYLPRLNRLATGRLPAHLRGSVDTGDLVQESLLKTIDKLDSFSPRHAGAFPAYLRKVLLNRIREEARRAAAKPTLSALDGTEIALAPSPLEASIGSELVEDYEAALLRLKENERAVLFLKIEMDMDYAEIADALDKPSVDAARKAVKRAVVRLARTMDTSNAT